jgi:glycerol-3-phosphate acyltransferase PlsY
VLIWLPFIVLAYLCGSIPFGLLIARWRGVDIRQHGSGNIGATNVGRVLGKKYGLLCFGLDALKGFLPTIVLGALVRGIDVARIAQPIELTMNTWAWLVLMAMTIVGHMYSPWIRFKGGKGVATGLGAMLGVFPYLTVPAVAALLIWGFIVFVWRYVSLASCIAALSLPLLVLGWGALSNRLLANPRPALIPHGFWPFVLVTSVMGMLVIYRHRGNIRRLIAGTESRIGGRRVSTVR